jgi:hypothetical protein
MPTLTRDTTPQAEAVQLAILRRMPAWQKVALATQLNQRTEELALRGLRTRYPHAAERELRRRLFDLKLGPALALRVYGPLEQWMEPADA